MPQQVAPPTVGFRGGDLAATGPTDRHQEPTVTRTVEYTETRRSPTGAPISGSSVYLRPEAHTATQVGLDRLACRVDPTHASKYAPAECR